MTVAAEMAVVPEDGFRHEAFFYGSEDEFLDGTTAFIRAGVVSHEPVLVVVSAPKIDLLKGRLGPAAAAVRFADMDDVGLNPARIIPAWSEFIEEHGQRPVRGIGEPIWASRSPDELVECQRHESLLNVAFAHRRGFTLLCPYDTASLGQDVLDEARHSHPHLDEGGVQSPSPRYPGVDALAQPFSSALPPPPSSSVDLVFKAGSLGGVRAVVEREATHAGLGEAGVADAVIAVNEVASNSVAHAGGWGVLRMWPAGDSFVCEVSDDGHIEEALVGRVRPEIGAVSGRGLWMTNQLCDLVQIRSTSTGTTVRLHFRPHASP